MNGPEQASTSASVARTTPSEDVITTWRTADCVCIDCDCTITLSDGLDLLAEFMGCKAAVDELELKQAKDGNMNMHEALEERLRALDLTPKDVRRFVDANPPEMRMTKGIVNLVRTLRKRGVAVYIISGGFRELILPIAKYLDVPKENLFANRMNWQWDDETGEPTRLSGFDMTQPTAFSKTLAIQKIREDNPYNTVVMIGDGWSDYEAVQSSQGADLFIGYGGVIERPAVAEVAEWFVYDHDYLAQMLKSSKVAMIGSGSFACAVMPQLSRNVALDEQFDSQVMMWVHEATAMHEGRPIIDIINTDHQNPKYLPGVHLGDNVVASSDLESVAKDADVFVFCAPYEYMHGITRRLMGKVKRDAVAISLVKGMHMGRDGPHLISQMIRKNLGLDCSVLMGGNLAEDLARKELSEAVIGASSRETGSLFRKLFQTSYFYVDVVQDVAGAEMCGTLKNIVALGVGIVDGLGCGHNTKSAIMREGLAEMRKLSKALHPDVRSETFFESCGVGDLVATCMGGRNHRLSEEWTRAWKAGTPRTWRELEAQMLDGTRLQGVCTSNEVQEVLRARKWEPNFPLFTCINRIITNKIQPPSILTYKEGSLSVAVEIDEDEIIPPRRDPRGAHSRQASLA